MASQRNFAFQHTFLGRTPLAGTKPEVHVPNTTCPAPVFGARLRRPHHRPGTGLLGLRLRCAPNNLTTPFLLSSKHTPHGNQPTKSEGVGKRLLPESEITANAPTHTYPHTYPHTHTHTHTVARVGRAPSPGDCGCVVSLSSCLRLDSSNTNSWSTLSTELV